MYTSTMDGDTVEKRLLQGTYLDAQKAGFTGTKAEFDTKLKELLENSDNLTGIVPVERGGTGAGTAPSALTNLGLVRKNVDWDETGLGNPFFGTGNTNGPDGSLTVGGFSAPLDGVRSLTVAGRANNLWFRTIENNTLGTWRTIYHSGNLPPVYKWAYNYQNGYLVKTDIAVNDTAATMFTATIAGNSYASSKPPIDMRIQGYIYGTGKIITGCSGLNLGYDAIKTVRAFGYEGVLYLWVAQEVRYQSLGFNIVTSYETTSQPAGYNRVVSVTNAAEPATGLTWPVTIPIKSTYNALNVNLATIDWNVRNLNCNGQIVYTPPANQSTATGSQWKLDGAITSGIGSYYVANEGFRWNYVGWGTEPYLAASCLAVSDSLLKYKNLDVWHAGNANLSTIDWAAKKLTLADNISWIAPETGRIDKGMYFKSSTGYGIAGIGATIYNDSTSYLFIGWGLHPDQAVTSLRVGETHFKYKDQNIWHAGNSNLATIDWNAKNITANGILYSISNGDGQIRLANKATGGQASGIWFTKSDSINTPVGGIGGSITSDVFNRIYLGWGDKPWYPENSLAVASEFIKYKNFDIWHAGNFNPASKLDATATAENTKKLFALDDRDIKPTDLYKKAVHAVFADLNQMAGTTGAGADYQDVLVLNTYGDISAGRLNILLFDKSTMEIKHWQAAQGDTEWSDSAKKVIAYTDGTIANAANWTGKPTWIGNSKPTYTAAEVGALASGGTAVNAAKVANKLTINGTAYDGSAPVTITTPDTDTKVTVNANTATNAEYPLTFAASTKTTTAAETNGLNKAGDKLFFNPSTGTLTTTTFAGNLTGNAATATNAANWTGKPSWIGSSKPTYTAAEVGALAAGGTAVNAAKVANKLTINGTAYDGSAPVAITTPDTKVTVNTDTETNADYPIVFASTTNTTTTAVNGALNKAGTKLYFNPSSGKLTSASALIGNITTGSLTVSGENIHLANGTVRQSNPTLLSPFAIKLPGGSDSTYFGITPQLSSYPPNDTTINYGKVGTNGQRVGGLDFHHSFDGSLKASDGISTGSTIIPASGPIRVDKALCSPFAVTLSTQYGNYFGIYGDSGPSATNKVKFGLVNPTTGEGLDSGFNCEFLGNVTFSSTVSINDVITATKFIRGGTKNITPVLIPLRGSQYAGIYGDTDTTGYNINYGLVLAASGAASSSSIVPFHTFKGNIRATGSVTPNYTSDERFKQNIRPVESAREIINRLNPVSFNWNDFINEHFDNKDTGKLNYGFIAQEVEKVLPDTIGTIYTDEYKSIDYIQIIPLLAAAIKEQDAIIGEQNEKIGALESRLEILEKSILAGTENNPDENTGTSGNGNAV